MRFLSDFLSSRGRVIVAALVTVVLQIGYFFVTVPWIEHHSTSAGTNLLLIVLFMLLSIFAGFLIALFWGDTFYEKAWRGQVFDTVSIAHSDVEVDLYESARIMQKRTRQFSAGVVVFSAVLVMAGNWAAGNFFERYQRVGYYKTVFRGDNAKMKLSAMKQIALQYGSDLEVRAKLLVPLLDAKSPRIRRGAANALARITKQTAREVRMLWGKGFDVDSRWEHRVLTEMRERVVPRLFTLLKTTKDENFKLGAWLAIAAALPDKIEDFAIERRKVIVMDSAERMAINIVLGKVAAERASIAKMWAGQMNLESTPILLEEMDASRPERTRIAALWAMGMILDGYEDPGLRQGKDSTGRPQRKQLNEEIDKAIERIAQIAEEESLVLRCAAFEALLHARDSRQDLMLFRALAEAPRDASCPSQFFKLPGTMPVTLVRESDLRFKILEVIASIAVGNRRVIARLEQIMGDRDVYGVRFLRIAAGVLRSVELAEGR